MIVLIANLNCYLIIFSQGQILFKATAYSTVQLKIYNKKDDRDILEKAMAPHSSTLAWKIPWTEEPGRLQSMGSLRVKHD